MLRRALLKARMLRHQHSIRASSTNTTTQEYIVTEVIDGVGVITLNRPKASDQERVGIVTLIFTIVT